MQKTSESSGENADGAMQMHTPTGNEEKPLKLMEVNVFLNKYLIPCFLLICINTKLMQLMFVPFSMDNIKSHAILFEC